MDNFMDRLAQKLSSQEVIKANAQAEAAELKRLRTQLGAYEECLAEMKAVNQKNEQLLGQAQETEGKSRTHLEQAQESARQMEALRERMDQTEQERSRLAAARAQQIDELHGKLHQLVEDGLDKIAAIPEEDGEARKKQMEEIRAALEESQKRVSELFAESDEFVHKENVKVYRNVQAVIVDELKAQTEQLLGKQQQAQSRSQGLKKLVIAALGVSCVNAGMLIALLLIVCGVI